MPEDDAQVTALSQVRRAAGADASVRRAVPLLGRAWGPVAGVISGLLFDVVEQEAAFDPALAAWGRLGTAIRREQRPPLGTARPCLPVVFVTVRLADVAELGAAARELGREAGAGTGGLLRRTAEAVGRTPVQLVVQLARMHGVLDLDLGSDGDVLHRWGTDGPVFARPAAEAVAAQRRIAARVHEMWRAGAEREVGR